MPTVRATSSLFLVLVCSTFASSCIGPVHEIDRPSLTPAETEAVLAIANTFSRQDLVDDVGLHETVARALVKYRDGQDRIAGTADDNPIDTIEELEHIPVVSGTVTGPSVTQKIAEYHRQYGGDAPPWRQDLPSGGEIALFARLNVLVEDAVTDSDRVVTVKCRIWGDNPGRLRGSCGREQYSVTGMTVTWLAPSDGTAVDLDGNGAFKTIEEYTEWKAEISAVVLPGRRIRIDAFHAKVNERTLAGPNTPIYDERLALVSEASLVTGFGLIARASYPPGGGPMVEVPAATAEAGCTQDPCGAGARPYDPAVALETFSIDLTEVTQAEYERCILEGSCGYPGEALGCRTGGGEPCRAGGTWDPAECPDCAVEGVRWDEALAYCAYAGKRLPTEAEWERAARGTDGRVYPWGDEEQTCQRARYADCDGGREPVGVHPEGAGPYGALDIAGGLREWVYDNFYYTDPEIQDSMQYAVVRGGGYETDGASLTTYSFAEKHANRTPELDQYRTGIGFRCAYGQPRVESEPNDSIEQATPLGPVHENVLWPRYAHLEPNGRDVFSLRAPGPIRIVARIIDPLNPLHPILKVKMRLLGADGSTVAEAQTGWGSGGVNAPTVLFADLPEAGTYFVEIRGRSTTAEGDYGLHVSIPRGNVAPRFPEPS